MRQTKSLYSPLPTMAPMLDLWKHQMALGVAMNRQLMKAAFTPWQMAIAFAPRRSGDAPASAKRVTAVSATSRSAAPETGAAPAKAVPAAKRPVLASTSGVLAPAPKPAAPKAPVKPASRPKAANGTMAAAQASAPARPAKATQASASPKSAASKTAAVTPAPTPPAEAPKAAASALANAPATLTKPKGGKGDDLTVIKGIGPKLASEMNALGIWHLEQIAAWTPAQAEWLDTTLPTTRGGAQRGDWAGQAKRWIDASRPAEKSAKT